MYRTWLLTILLFLSPSLCGMEEGSSNVTTITDFVAQKIDELVPPDSNNIYTQEKIDRLRLRMVVGGGATFWLSFLFVLNTYCAYNENRCDCKNLALFNSIFMVIPGAYSLWKFISEVSTFQDLKKKLA